MDTTAELSEFAQRLPDLMKKVAAGDEVLLLDQNKPVAKLIPIPKPAPLPAELNIRSFKGHKIVSPVISQAELAAEMFDRWIVIYWSNLHLPITPNMRQRRRLSNANYVVVRPWQFLRW